MPVEDFGWPIPVRFPMSAIEAAFAGVTSVLFLAEPQPPASSETAVATSAHAAQRFQLI
jgi:hypothetical protein